MKMSKEIKEKKDIFDLMFEGCQLDTKEICVMTIANLFKVAGMANEYLNIQSAIINYNEVERDELEKLYNKRDVCGKMLNDEIKLVDNFVATLATGEYARKFDEKLLKMSKLEIVTQIMKDSNSAIDNLKDNMNKMVENEEKQEKQE